MSHKVGGVLQRCYWWWAENLPDKAFPLEKITVLSSSQPLKLSSTFDSKKEFLIFEFYSKIIPSFVKDKFHLFYFLSLSPHAKLSTILTCNVYRIFFCKIAMPRSLEYPLMPFHFYSFHSFFFAKMVSSYILKNFNTYLIV